MTRACERAGCRAWTEARGVSTRAVVGPALGVADRVKEDARQIAPDQTGVCRDSTPEQERGRTS